MAYLKAIEIDTLTLPSAPEYWVKIKRRATYGDQVAAQSAMLKVDTASAALSDIEWGSYIRSLTAAMVVEWNLTDEQDRALPITAESIDRLEPEDGQFLAAEITKRAALRSPERERPFDSPSSQPSTDTP